MKIGILTFSAAFNFGAVLQCYALYSTLKQLGYYVEVINYRPEYLVSFKPQWSIHDWLNRDIFTLYKRRRTYKYWRKIYDGYMDFETYNMSMSKPCTTLCEVKNIISQLDCVIVGSDQVWNLKFNKNDLVWYGFDDFPYVRWVSYAASAGDSVFSSELKRMIPQIISRFKYISVREKDLCNAFQYFTEKKIELVLDPTLLVPYKSWEKWLKPIKKNKYILTYQARKSDYVFKIARHLSSQLGDIEIVPIDLWDNVKSNGFKSFLATPSDFISLIKNASCVVTTSFHGTAFAITLGTSFYSLKLYDGCDGRIENLLEQFNLSHRLLDVTDSPQFTPIDFSEIQPRLDYFRELSLSFLRNSVE